jgi:hypothetical protein
MSKNPTPSRVPNDVIPKKGIPRVNILKNDEPSHAAPAIPTPMSNSRDIAGRISVATIAISAARKYAEPAVSAFEAAFLILRVDI